MFFVSPSSLLSVAALDMAHVSQAYDSAQHGRWENTLLALSKSAATLMRAVAFLHRRCNLFTLHVSRQQLELKRFHGNTSPSSPAQ
mmetsp:Transcript_31250/g.100249  ORF Transcript_31250/g.100249 Transcript_31250/m.100249 type:complete len:86 (-) Transcript_31250:91-348(-)